MYSSIPNYEALNVLKGKLTNNRLNSNEINEIIQCIKIITNPNYFQYNKQLNTQNYGFVMGSSLSLYNIIKLLIYLIKNNKIHLLKHILDMSMTFLFYLMVPIDK